MAKKHGETKKENKWMEDEQKGVKQRGKADIQKGKMLNWRRNTPFSLSLSKKNDSKNGNYSEKLGFFQMSGKYVKGENKEGAEKG